MKFYIASRLGNYQQVQLLAEKLKTAGWIHTYDWTDEWMKHKPTDLANEQDLAAIAKQEFEGVAQADVVIILTPQGRGTHIELGMALALNKTVFICHSDDTYFKGDDNTTAFYLLPQIIRVIGDTEEIAEKVLKHVEPV